MSLAFPEALTARLRQARRVAVLTGAGISAESGIPTFRDVQTGYWARYDPQELASPQGFRKNPGLVWDWYAYRRELISKAGPNPGHYALAEMEQRIDTFTLITQNVDGLHSRAGSGSRVSSGCRCTLIELHGNIFRTRCFEQNHPVTEWHESAERPPRCPLCNGLLRPDVVWFGESLPPNALEQSWSAAQECEIFFSIGTSGLVQPAASVPLVAQQAGALLVEINPNQTPLSEMADVLIQAPAGTALPALLEAAWGIDRPASPGN